MSQEGEYQTERLDHLGIVAEVCREVGIAEWLDTQAGKERGFRFLKDPFFLASSVFVKRPERVIVLSFVMVLCVLVYRLAEHLLRRHQLVATQQTVPNQVNKPTHRPTMRWIFHCFEGIDLLHIRIGSRWHTQVLGLRTLHQQILRPLGPAYSQFYFFSP